MSTHPDHLIDALDDLKRVAPASCRSDELLKGLMRVIDRHLRPLPDADQHRARTSTLIARYCNALEKRSPARRPKTKPGVFKSLSTFITKDIRAAAKEYAAFEARAEKAITGNAAMHFTSRGVANHKERALNILDRFLLIVAQQWEHLASFKSKIQELENQYYDRDNWALHLHDRLNRLANLLTTVDAAVTSLKRALLNDRPSDRAVEALRALKDNSLNPLEFIAKVFSDDDRTCNIQVTPPQPPLTYSNHFMVREILLELTHNAIAAGASTISLRASPQDNDTARIEIADDCPGGIPQPVVACIGKQRIITRKPTGDELDLFDAHHPESGWGLYTVVNNLIPSLGIKASIDFDTPLGDHGGTRITIRAPIIRKSSPTVVKKKTAAFASLCADPFTIGGNAFYSSYISARIDLSTLN